MCKPIEMQIADNEKEFFDLREVCNNDDFRTIIKVETYYGDAIHLVIEKNRKHLSTLKKQARMIEQIPYSHEDAKALSYEYGDTGYWLHINPTDKTDVWVLIINAFSSPVDGTIITKGTFPHCRTFMQGYTFNLLSQHKAHESIFHSDVDQGVPDDGET